MAYEYRMRRISPDPERRDRVSYKRDREHALQSLTDWRRDMARYAEAGIEVWDAVVEYREVTEWRIHDGSSV